jgi:hypothetical protein
LRIAIDWLRITPHRPGPAQCGQCTGVQHALALVVAYLLASAVVSIPYVRLVSKSFEEGRGKKV